MDEELTTYDSTKSIYIAGGKEGEVMQRTAKELFDKLKVDKKENTMLLYGFLEDKTHGDPPAGAGVLLVLMPTPTPKTFVTRYNVVDNLFLNIYLITRGVV